MLHAIKRLSERSIGKDLTALLFLVVIVTTAFANVVFGGKSLLPSENLNPLDFRALEQNYGPGFVSHEEWTRRGLFLDPNYRDSTASLYQMEPSREFLRRSLLQREFPFWDPYVGGGAPMAASLIPAFFFPPSWIVVLLGNGSLVNNAYILFLIFVSGALTYFLLRHHGLAWFACVAGAAAFAFSGAVIQTAPSIMGQPTALFSLALLSSARLVEMPTLRRAAQLALAFGFIALASFPPILVQIFGMSLIYIVIAAILSKQKKRTTLIGWFVAGSVVAMAIVGVAYLPALRVIMDAPHIREYYASAGVEYIQPKLILQLLSPAIMGGGPIYSHPPFYGSTGQYFYYVGVIPILLGAIGFFARSDWRVRVLKITAIVATTLTIAKLLGFPPVQWVVYLPFFRSVHYAAYFGILVDYGVALLAAMGVDALVRGRVRRWQVGFSGGIILFILLVIRFVAATKSVSARSGGERWLEELYLLMIFVGAGVAVVTLAAQKPRAVRIALAGLLLVMATESVVNSYYPRQQRWDHWNHPPTYVQVIADQKSPGRILPMPVYGANLPQVYRQPTIDSLTLFGASRMFDFYKHYFSPAVDPFLRETKRLPREPILDAANIEYVTMLSNNGENVSEAARPGYEILFADDFVTLLRRKTSPRYFLTSDYVLAESADAALNAVGTGHPSQIVLESAPGFSASTEPLANARVQVTRFGLNDVELAVVTPRDAILMCSESQTRGWTATVDDRPAGILPANYAFRAVVVPSGSHTVRLHYRAPWFGVGLITSGLGLSMCLAGLLVPRRRRSLTAGSDVLKQTEINSANRSIEN